MKKNKKLMASTAAFLSVAAVTSLAVYAAQQYTADDLRDLSSALLGEAKITDSQDVNNDGKVDVYDLVTMRKTFAQTGEFKEQTITASDTNTRYIGRNIYSDNTAWLVQSGSAVEFTVVGRSAEVTLCGDKNTATAEDYRPRYAVLVDDEVVVDDLISKDDVTVKLFEGTESRSAKIKVIHLSEANNGAVGVKGIRVDSNMPAPVVPTAKKKLQIEFIGDSITCAYGVEGKDQYEGFKTSTENFMKSYAYLTAKQLDADYSAVCYSGHGIISGYSSSGDRMTESLVPDYYEYVGKLSGYQVPWDFSANKKDVVVINLGTNDDTYCGKDLETRGPEFTAEYVAFLNTVHKNNPDAYIICTLGTMGCTELYPYIQEAVKEFSSKSGYERIMCYQSATHSQADGLGSDWHPSEKTQQNSAYVLADKICQALGMESDQIGIDVASEVEFNTVQSDSSMVSDYLSDWDRSYHVTTVYGGEKPESIQVFAGPVGLRKGGVYTLKFQFTTSDGVEIPFVIRDKATGKVLYEDTVTGGGDKVQYEHEFTSPETCDAELVYSMGGVDSLRLSLYELKMVKTK